MSEFKIKTSVELDDSEAKKKLGELKSLGEEKPINLKLDAGKILSDLAKIEIAFKTAFKLDGASLSSLERVENTLKEINNLSNEVQKNLFSNKNKNTNVSDDESKRIKEDNMVMLAAMEEEKRIRKQQEKEREQARKQEQQATARQRQEQIQAYRQMFDDIENQQKQRTRREGEYARLFDSAEVRDNSEQQGLIRQYKDIENTITRLQSQMSRGLGEESIQRTTSEVERLRSQLDAVYSQLNSTSRQQIDVFDTERANRNLIEFNRNLSNIERQASSTLSRLNGTNFININDDEGRIESLKSELRELITMCQHPVDFNVDTGQALSRINEITQEVRNLERVENLRGSFEQIEGAIRQAFGDEHVSQFRAELQSLEGVARNLDGSFDSAFNGLNSQLRENQTQIRNMNRETRESSRFWTDFKSSFAAYSLGNIVGDGIVRSIHSSIEAFKDLDSAMTNMKKVADTKDINSAFKLDKIRNEAIQVSKDVGMSVSDTVNGIASSLQAGMGSMKESIQVARSAMILSNVGDMSQDVASQGLNTIINSFKIKPLKDIQVQVGNTTKKTNELTNSMDYLNHASNNYAITTNDLVQAFSNGGSVLSNYGVSLNDATAMITAANLSLQDGSRVGNGLKSISVNLASMKANAKNGHMELNKTAKALSEIAGIDVYSDKSKGEIKDEVQLLDEIDKKWGSLKENQRNALSEALAGKQQATVFQSLMQNYDTFKKMREEFARGDQFGSSERENERYVNSLAGKLNRLKTTWMSIGTTIVKSDFTYGMLDAFIALSEGIDKVIKSVDKAKMTLPAIIASFTTLRSLFKANNASSALAEGISGGLNPTANRGFLARTRGAFQDIRLATMSAGDGMRAYNSTLAEGGTRVAAARNGFSQLGNSLRQTAIGSKLMAVGSSLLTGALIGLATYGVSKAYQAWDEYNRRYEIAAEKNKENIANIKDETKSLQEQKSRLSSISEEYDTLAKKSNKSNEEIARFNDLKKEIAEISPDLVAGTDADGNPILALNGSLDDTIKKLEEAIRQKNELLKVQQNNLGTNETKNIGKTKEKLQSAIVGQVHDLLNEDYKFDKVFEDKAFADNSINAKLDRYKQSLEKKEQIVAQSNEKILEQLEEYNEKEAAIQQKAFNKLAEGKNYKGLKDEEIKGQLNSLTNDLNWGRFSLTEQNGIVSGLDKLAPILSKNKDKAKEWSDAMRDANTNFQASGDLEQYKKELQGTANELSKLTGISADTWIKGLMQEFGGLDLAKSKLHDFLKSYGSSTAELQKGNGFAITLQKQFQDLQGFMTDFTIDGKVNINLLKDIKNNKAFTDLPQQIKELISGVLGKDNKVTEVEQEVLLKISSSIEEKGKLSDDVSDKLNKLFQGKLSAKELKVPIKLANGMEIGTQQLGELNSLYAKNPVKVNFKAAGTPEEMLANVTKKLDGIKLEKDVRLKIEKGLAENDIGAVTEAINSLPEEKQVKVLAAIEEAYGNLNKVDKKKLKNKNLRLDAKDNATKTVNKVDKKKLKSKTTKISAKDNASKTINAIDRKQIKNKSFSIKVKTTFEKVMKTINETVRKAIPKNQRGSTDSIATPSLSPVTTQSYSPIIHRANPVSAFSQAQPSPMATTQTSDAITTTSSPSANLYSGGSSPRASVFASGSVSLKPTLKTPLALRGDDISNALNYDLDLLTELNNRIKIVTNSLAALDTKMDHAVGDEKIKYLREQNILFEQQKKLLKEQEDALIRHRNLYKDVLQRKGFKFNADNNMTNYEEKILALEKEHERLDKISSKEKSTDKQKSATEAAKKALDDAKKYAQEYFKVQMEELPNCKNEWDKLTNSIKDHNLEIKKLENDRWKNYTEATWTSMNRDVQEINNQLDMLDVLMKNAFGKDKNDMLQQKIDLLNKQKKEMGETTQQLRSVQNQLKKKAEGYGFKFRNDGTIENYIQQLDKLKNTSEEFDIAKDIIDEYMDVFMEKIPHAERELKELNNVIVETYKDKLEITSKIEDKITEMYKKQLEDRKKLINEELDAKVKSLDKQKKAYNDSRKNEEYKDDYEEQLKKVMDIQKKIDIAKRDTSESGKKKLKDLMKELEDNQKDLEKMVKDKTDSDVNDMFDNEKDRLEDVADKTIKDLEEKFSDSKIAELVSIAVSTGIFKGINGEISNLQDAITQFMKETGELSGVQGALINKEVVGNLQIALETVKDLKSIYDKLDLSKFDILGESQYKALKSSDNPYHITFNEPLMVVRGDITKDVLPEVKEMMKETEKRIVNNIAKNYKY